MTRETKDSVNVVVHLTQHADEAVVLPNVDMRKQIVWAMQEAIQRLSRKRHSSHNLALSGLYDMHTGMVVDLSQTIGALDTTTKFVRLGAVYLSDSNNRAKSSSPFETFVKSIASSLSPESPSSRKDTDPTKTFPIFQQLKSAPLTLVECIKQLRFSTPEELSLQCRTSLASAKTLLNQIDSFADGGRVFDRLHSLEKDESYPVHIENEDNNVDLGEEAPILLEFSPDTPMFRRDVVEIDSAFSSYCESLHKILSAAKASAISSQCYVSTLQEFTDILTEPIDIVDHPSMKYLASATNEAWKPFRESMQRLVNHQLWISNEIQGKFIAPLDQVIKDELSHEREKYKRQLNEAFYKYHAIALEGASDPYRTNCDELVEAAGRVFEHARLQLVRQLNSCYLKMLSVLEASSKDMVDIFATPLDPTTSTVPLSIGRAQVEAYCRVLHDEFPLVQDEKKCGFLFQVHCSVPEGDCRIRRWFMIENNLLCSLEGDKRTTETILSLSSCRVEATSTVPIYSHIRNGFVITSPELVGTPLILQADTASDCTQWIFSLQEHLSVSSGPEDDGIRYPRAFDLFESLISPTRLAFHNCHPNEFQLLASGKLPISIKKYWEMFVATSTFTFTMLSKRQAIDIQVSEWDACQRRTRSCTMPIQSALSKGSTRVMASEMYQVLSSTALEIHSIDQSLDVPYGSYFTIESKTIVHFHDALHCDVEMFMAIHFAKATMFKRMIENACLAEAKTSCQSTLDLMRSCIASSKPNEASWTM